MNKSSIPKEMRPIDVATMESLEFVEANVALKGATVLEVGAGRGDLAVALMERGAVVHAIDLFQDAVMASRAKGVNATLADFLDYSSEPFDIVIFTRSLHHIHPLERAVHNAASLLKPTGTLLVEEFGAELADARTVQWLDEKLTQLEKSVDSADGTKTDGAESGGVTVGAVHSKHDSKHESKTSSLQKWRDHHFGKHWISDSAAVREGLAKKFHLEPLKMVPYMYRYAIDRLQENQVGYEELLRIHEEEKALIAKGALRPIGLHIVGKRK